jgi:KTSC domain
MIGDDEELGGSEYDGTEDIPVDSSAISSVRYSEADNIMNITFSTGMEYELNGVDRDTFDRFMASSSKGSFFNSQMKGRY